MLNKIKNFPEKRAFIIDLALIVITPIPLFLQTQFYPTESRIMLFVEGALFLIAILFILTAANQRLIRKEHK